MLLFELRLMLGCHFRNKYCFPFPFPFFVLDWGSYTWTAQLLCQTTSYII